MLKVGLRHLPYNLPLYKVEQVDTHVLCDIIHVGPKLLRLFTFDAAPVLTRRGCRCGIRTWFGQPVLDTLTNFKGIFLDRFNDFCNQNFPFIYKLKLMKTKNLVYINFYCHYLSFYLLPRFSSSSLHNISWFMFYNSIFSQILAPVCPSLKI